MSLKYKLSENFRKITIPIHLLFFCSLYLLFIKKVEGFNVIGFLIFWSIFSGLGIAIGYHRLLSHKSFKCKVFVKRALATFGLFAGQGSPIFWTATHRGLHHPYSDTKKDPHSPQNGFFHSFIGWQLSFGKKDFNIKHAIELVRDPYLKFISMQYHKIYWLFVVGSLLIDWKFALLTIIPAMILATHQENIVNTFCHLKKLGYRNFNTNDYSNNIWLFGIIFWGQGLHNNHHKYPRFWNFAVKWWEFDPCSLIIPLISTDLPEQQMLSESNFKDTQVSNLTTDS